MIEPFHAPSRRVLHGGDTWFVPTGIKATACHDIYGGSVLTARGVVCIPTIVSIDETIAIYLENRSHQTIVIETDDIIAYILGGRP